MATDPSTAQGVAREEVMKCEQEIQSIKTALRRLGAAQNNEEPNSMEILLLKVCYLRKYFVREPSLV
jgi:hypothetical protein